MRDKGIISERISFAQTYAISGIINDSLFFLFEGLESPHRTMRQRSVLPDHRFLVIYFAVMLKLNQKYCWMKLKCIKNRSSKILLYSVSRYVVVILIYLRRKLPITKFLQFPSIHTVRVSYFDASSHRSREEMYYHSIWADIYSDFLLITINWAAFNVLCGNAS